jgi:serpin B
MVNIKMIAIILILGLIFCSGNAIAQNNDKPGKNLDTRGMKIANGNNEFAVELYKKISKPDENVFFSPYSISTALAMTYAAAKGKTAQEMEQTLHFKLKNGDLHKGFSEIISDLNARGKQGNYKLNVANRIWVKAGLNPTKAFMDIVRKYYFAAAEILDFAGNPESSRVTINTWVEKMTNGKIKNLIPKGVIKSDTQMVLTNAIYFFGNWQSQFEEKRTSKSAFNVSPSKKIDVQMMHKTESFGYKRVKDLKVLALPYKGNELSMVIFLPDKVDGIKDLEKSLTYKNIEQWTSGLDTSRVVVSLPKFKMSSGFNLNQTLAAMGMKSAFTGTADFSGIAKGIFISAILHKAYVDVNERGTEAAAATAVVMTKSAAPKVDIFNADHPFIFLIRDNKSGSILFMGKLMDPSK